VTFADLGAAPPLGMVAVESGATLDIAEGLTVVGLTVVGLSSDSSSDGEGVGGKYSKLGESKSKARDIE
jgi:hypothetical protein